LILKWVVIEAVGTKISAVRQGSLMEVCCCPVRLQMVLKELPSGEVSKSSVPMSTPNMW